jgi:hypothetical protein
VVNTIPVQFERDNAHRPLQTAADKDEGRAPSISIQDEIGAYCLSGSDRSRQRESRSESSEQCSIADLRDEVAELATRLELMGQALNTCHDRTTSQPTNRRQDCQHLMVPDENIQQVFAHLNDLKRQCGESQDEYNTHLTASHRH